MKTKEAILRQLLDEVYEEFPNESYSDWDIAEYVFDKLQPKWIKIESESDLTIEIVSCWFKRRGLEEVEVGLFIPRGDGIDSIIEDVLQNCTHYALIIKPSPPIY